ncbi:MFS transporter [Sporosarcina sp. FA9]|uniref:MFS transporter n=1 Tax=Sporosarcina sp. FA9 TaxID=3413030 RepID=UPI003F6602C6
MIKEFTKKDSVLLLIAIFAVAVNMRPAITSIGPMLEVIREQLSLSNVQVSMLTAIPVICMGIFATFAPYFNRKLGLKRTMYLMLSLIGLLTAIRGIVPSFIVLIGTAFLIGVALAVMGPLLSAMIKQNFPQRAASVIGVYSFGMGVGASASAGFTVLFYDRTSSYPFALGIWAVLALLGLLAWFFAMRVETVIYSVRQSPLTEKQEKSVSPWRIKKAWLFLLFFGLQSSAFFSIVTWLVPMAKSLGMTLLQAGMLLSVMTVVQIFLNLGFPLLMERFPARRFWVLLMLISGVLATLFIWTGVHSLMWIGAIVMGIPLGGLFPIALLLPLDETETADETNSWTAMMQTGGYIIGGLFPLVIALIHDWTGDHNYTFIIFLGFYIALMILTLLIGEKNEIQ